MKPDIHYRSGMNGDYSATPPGVCPYPLTPRLHGWQKQGNGNMKKIHIALLFASLLVCITANAATEVIEGETGRGSKYQISVPDNWNGDLVVYAHGFIDAALPVALPTNDDSDALRDLLTDNGYAVAVSSYSANGFAVREGIHDTQALNYLFIQAFGQPDRTFLVGYSLGGAVCARLAELFPNQYDGVLTVAGMIGGSQAEIDYVANVRILFEFFYPGVLPGAIDDVPDNVDLINEVVYPIVYAISADPTGAGGIAMLDQTPVPYASGPELVESFYRAIGFWYRGYDDVANRAGASFYGNQDTVYTSAILSSSVLDWINAYVERFEASNRAEKYLQLYYQPTGKLNIPHFALHNSRDPAVPVFHQTLYADLVDANGSADLLAQRITERYGHTETYPASEVYDAFSELVEWINNGVVPVP